MGRNDLRPQPLLRGTFARTPPEAQSRPRRRTQSGRRPGRKPSPRCRVGSSGAELWSYGALLTREYVRFDATLDPQELNRQRATILQLPSQVTHWDARCQFTERTLSRFGGNASTPGVQNKLWPGLVNTVLEYSCGPADRFARINPREGSAAGIKPESAADRELGLTDHVRLKE